MFDIKKMGEQIAYLRRGNNYTQEQLAEELKVSPQAVSKWENGKAIPEVPMLCEISGLFNCSVDRILYGQYFCRRLFRPQRSLTCRIHFPGTP